MKNKILCLLFSVVLAVIDLFIKFYVKNYLNNKDSIKILNGFLEVIYLENRGAALGILNKNIWLLIFISLIFIIFFILMLFMKRRFNNIFLISSAFIIGGGIGNLANRILTGYVIDYIKLCFFNPVFNFADCCLTLGFIGLIIYSQIT